MIRARSRPSRPSAACLRFVAPLLPALAAFSAAAPAAAAPLAAVPAAASTAAIAAETLAPAFLTAHIPPRPAGARTGSQFLAYVRGMDGRTREQAIRAELLAGNLPEFLRRLKKVELQGAGGGRATVWVMPDYLAIGSDQDYVRFPASYETASAVARHFGFVLPTTTIVDAIYAQADLRLQPQTMTPGPAMTSTAYFESHDGKIREQTSGHPPGELVAGHKKDYVLTGRLLGAATQEAIYGWHRGVGAPIQPLSLVHGSRYADYSHGVRLVAETVFYGGAPRSYFELLAEPGPASLLSREGAIAGGRAMLERWAGTAGPYVPPMPTAVPTAAPVAAALASAAFSAPAPAPAERPGSCSSGNPGGSSDGSSGPSPDCRAKTELASDTSPRGPGSGRK